MATTTTHKFIGCTKPVTVNGENGAYLALEDLPVGRTRVINGNVVTRWSTGRYEIGTWGQDTCDVHEAAATVFPTSW
jgi:hypothetical protein